MAKEKRQHRPGQTRNWISISIAVVAVVIILYWVGALKIAELKSLDLMFRLRGHLEPNPDIVVVAIDDLTLSELGMEWPLSRSLHAQVITQLQTEGAKFVGIVFPMPEPSGNSAEDTNFVRSLEKAGMVWLPEEFSEANDTFYNLQSLSEPGQIFKDAATGTALVNLTRDEDSVIRRISLTRVYQDKLHYHIAAAANFAVTGGELPGPKSHSLLINYAGPTHTYKTVSYYQVLEDLLPADFFRDKVVLIGLTSATLADSFPTPFSGSEPMSRAEIIANALGNLLEQNPLTPVSLPLGYFITLAVAGVVATTTVTQPLFRGSVLMLLTGVIYFFICFIFFRQQQLWLPIAMPLAALALSYGSLTLYRYNMEQRQKRELRRLFSRYVSEEVVEDILKQNDAQILGGKRQELTVLFSDIRGFTSLSQRLSPEQVVALLNHYLTDMTGVIFQNKGTIDKFLGDGIMVMFGAPLPLADAPQQALNTAIQMQQKMQELDLVWEREGPGRLQMGIGIHTGDAVIGNIGSPLRMNYTAIGDTVNIASRLQELTKTYGYSIILSESTLRRIQPPIKADLLGAEVLRGRNEPINIYGVTSTKT